MTSGGNEETAKYIFGPMFDKINYANIEEGIDVGVSVARLIMNFSLLSTGERRRRFRWMDGTTQEEVSISMDELTIPPRRRTRLRSTNTLQAHREALRRIGVNTNTFEWIATPPSTTSTTGD